MLLSRYAFPFVDEVDGEVAVSVMLGFSRWWVGDAFPEGFVTNVFPPLAKILLQEDDPEVLEVQPPPPRRLPFVEGMLTRDRRDKRC